MSKAFKLLSILEERTVTVALFSFRPKTGVYFNNVDIFGFELWDIPVDDPVISDIKICTSPYELFSKMSKLNKSKLTKFNPTKQRIWLQRYIAEDIIIPDKVWIRLGIDDPSDDQVILMQCLVFLYKQYNVRIFGLDNQQVIKDLGV